MRTWLLIASASLLLFAIANRRRELLELADGGLVIQLEEGWAEFPGDTIAEPTQGNAIDAWLSMLDPSTYLPAMTDADTAARNERAFLSMIRHAEGTAGANGYRTRFGGGIFSNDYRDHPRIAVQFIDRAGRKLWTSAAGAYQFMAISHIPRSMPGRTTKVDTWDRIAAKLELRDFSPESQDRAALELIDEAGALNDVRAGRFASAVDKVRRIWASLPGAGYAQPEKSLASLESAYLQAGGQLA